MAKSLVFFVPYHTGYAHMQFVQSFVSFADVHLFVYKWNTAKQLIQDYFAESVGVQVHDFSTDNILTELAEQQRQQRRVVVLLTASMNYMFGKSQLLYFRSIQKHALCMIDVYSTGHCMYGCQSCDHTCSYRLPITFTNYIRTKDLPSIELDKNTEIVICPSFSSADVPDSLLSNKEIVEEIVTFPFPHIIKLHPLTHQFGNGTNPLFSLSALEQESVRKLLTSKSLLPAKLTNTLKLIEHAHVLICDSDSSIPFEALYFNDPKHILVYERVPKDDINDDRRAYFHIFHNAEQLNQLLDRYFAGELEYKTKNSHQFFLEKYDEPDGKEIERLANMRQWMSNHSELDQNLDIKKIKQEIKEQVESLSTQTSLYVLGEHTASEIEELSNGDISEAFGDLLQNISEL